MRSLCRLALGLTLAPVQIAAGCVFVFALWYVEWPERARWSVRV